ncbi:MAG: class I adenylate-forming enzyme family protein [Bryobacteraceae bacterium]
MRDRCEATRDGFIGMFLDVVNAYPDQAAITMLNGQETGATLSYGELNALAERLRFTLLARGVAPGETVLLQLATGPWSAAAMLAISSLGAIFAPINPDLTDFELSRIVEDCQPVGVLSAQRPPASRSIRFVIASEADLMAGHSALRVPDGNPVISCHYTYKGLGYPLGVLHRYEQYSWCLRALTASHAPQAVGAVHLLALPVYQIYGAIGGLLGPLASGCHLLVSRDIFDQDIPQLLERHQVSFLCVVPLLLKRITMGLRRKQTPKGAYRLHKDLFIVSGGSLMPAETAADMREMLGVEVYQGYGLTETMPVCGTLPGHNKPGSLGRPYADFLEMAVLDAESQPLAAGCAGIIGFRGPTLTLGFLNHPELTDEFFRNGWFHTGDLGYRDDDGYLWFLGRAGAFTKVASQMVDLTEVEGILATFPGVKKARMTVDMHAELGEMLVASVELKAGAGVTKKDLRAACSALLSTYKVPRQYRIYSSPKKEV